MMQELKIVQIHSFNQINSGFFTFFDGACPMTYAQSLGAVAGCPDNHFCERDLRKVCVNGF